MPNGELGIQAQSQRCRSLRIPCCVASNGEHWWPGGLEEGLGITQAIGWVVNVRKEDFTTAGELARRLVHHRLHPVLEAGDPQSRLRPDRAVHRLLTRRGFTVVVNEVIAGRSDDDDGERLAWCDSQRASCQDVHRTHAVGHGAAYLIMRACSSSGADGGIPYLCAKPAAESQQDSVVRQPGSRHRTPTLAWRRRRAVA